MRVCNMVIPPDILKSKRATQELELFILSTAPPDERLNVLEVIHECLDEETYKLLLLTIAYFKRPYQNKHIAKVLIEEWRKRYECKGNRKRK